MITDKALTNNQLLWVQKNNRWFEANLTDPFIANPELRDRSAYPHTSSWFRADATEFTERTAGYLEILDSNGVAWVELRSRSPGPIVYADNNQVVVAAVCDSTNSDAGIVIIPGTSESGAN